MDMEKLLPRLEGLRDDVLAESLALASVVVRDRLRADPEASEAVLSALSARAVLAFNAGVAALLFEQVSPAAAPAAPAP